MVRTLASNMVQTWFMSIERNVKNGACLATDLEVNQRKQDWLSWCQCGVTGLSVLSGVFGMIFRWWQHPGDVETHTYRHSLCD